MDMTELIKKSNSKIPKVRIEMLLQKVLQFTEVFFVEKKDRETENFFL